MYKVALGRVSRRVRPIATGTTKFCKVCWLKKRMRQILDKVNDPNYFLDINMTSPTRSVICQIHCWSMMFYTMFMLSWCHIMIQHNSTGVKVSWLTTSKSSRCVLLRSTRARPFPQSCTLTL